MTQLGEEILRALEAAREEHPDQANWLDFHRDLFVVQWAVRQTLSPLANPVTPERVDARRRAQEPIFAFDELEVDWEVVQRLFQQVDDIVARSLPDWLGGSLTEYSEEAVRAWYLGQDPGDARFAFLAAQSLRPFLHRAADATRPLLPENAYRNWGRCPTCGGKPDMAILEEETGARRLFCARCDTGWRYKRIGCPFCGTDNPYQLGYYLGPDPAYRLYVCEDCRQYLKTLDLRQGRRPFYLLVERALTVGLGLAAQEAGYGG